MEMEPPEKRVFNVLYLGSSTMDKRYTQNVQPWVMAEIRRRKDGFREVLLEVAGEHLRVTAHDSKGSELLFEHNVHAITRFAKLHLDPCCFGYLIRQKQSHDFECSVFRAESENTVPEIFNTIREASKDHPHPHPEDGVGAALGAAVAAGEGGNGAESGGTPGNNKSFYEVMYVGRAKVAQKRVTTSYVDDLVERLEATEEERLRNALAERQRHASGASVKSLPTSLEDAVSVTENDLELQQRRLTHANSHDSSTEELASDAASSSENISDPQLRSSIGCRPGGSLENVAEPPTPIPGPPISKSADELKTIYESESRRRHVSGPMDKQSPEEGSGSGEVFAEGCFPPGNRTMLFQISRNSISFISLDKKTTILERLFKDISFVSQGNQRLDVFGVIAREPGQASNMFVCHILKCHSESVVSDIMTTLQMAFQTAYSHSHSSVSQHQICTTCPLHQLHRLCVEINKMAPSAAYEYLSKRMDSLPEKDTAEIWEVIKNENPQSYDEMVEVIMIGIRKLCERKQKEHTHISDGARNVKPEFNLFDDKSKSSAFAGWKTKARKSLTSSLDNLIRGGRKKDELPEGTRRRSCTTTDSESSWGRSYDSSATTTPDASPLNSPMCKEGGFTFGHPDSPGGTPRQRSSTLGALPDHAVAAGRKAAFRSRKSHHDIFHHEPNANSPIHSMYLSSLATPTNDTNSPLYHLTPPFPKERRLSWRQTIFNRVVTPVSRSSRSVLEGNHSDTETVHRRSSTELRALWRKAILETLLLIRMEKENHNIRAEEARQDEAETRRQKLDYVEVTPCLREISQTWEDMLTHPDRPKKEYEQSYLLDCIKKGVPRSRRGAIWQLLVEQQCLRHGEEPLEDPCSYSDLLKQLTTHQHAILIDLGRTFPGHPYFSTQLGSGQLELFNLLKAYSLLDQEVGYCQGLSFIAGILIMHLEEADAFEILKHLMFAQKLRDQFKPNMTELQVKLYKLTRLIHDRHEDLYQHLENHEIAPTLYAAPWFLTLFASQFPLGFVARVFDLIFTEGVDAIFKVMLALLGNHKELIIQCDSFETIVEFLKTTLPEMAHVQMERVINQAFELDLAAELAAYEVEYAVLREEMLCSPMLQRGDSGEAYLRLESANRSLRQQNSELKERLAVAAGQVSRLEQQQHSLEMHNQSLKLANHSLELANQAMQDNEEKLRSKVRTYELERTALLNAISQLRRVVPLAELEKLGLPDFSPTPPVSPLHQPSSLHPHSPQHSEAHLQAKSAKQVAPKKGGRGGILKMHSEDHSKTANAGTHSTLSKHLSH